MSGDRDPAESDELSDSESYDAGNPDHIRKRKRKLAVNEANQDKFLARILGDALGRALLWELLGLSDWMLVRYGNTQQITDHVAGERERAFQVMRRLMRRQPNLTAQMIAENDNG